MTRRPVHPILLDQHIWRAQFHGLKMFAFGREQILDYTAEIDVTNVQLDPPVWMARFRGGDFEPFFNHSTPEDVMRAVAEVFITQVTPWQAFLRAGLLPERPVRPEVVKRRARKLG